MKATRMRTLVLVLGLIVSAPVWGQNINNLPGFYKDTQKDQEAHYLMTLESGGEKHQFDVAYRIKQKGFVTITMETERRYHKVKEKKGRLKTTEFRIKDASFKDQLEANYEKYGYRNMTGPGGGLWQPKVVGKEKVKVGGKEFECVKVQVQFKATRGGKPFTGDETYYYNAELPVMRMAKMEGTYSFETAGGRVTQKVTLLLTKYK